MLHSAFYRFTPLADPAATARRLRALGALDGGILHYFAALPDAALDWQGECFVFDNRMALDTRLNETPTTAGQVFDATRPDEAWRLERARRLDASAGG